MDLSNDPIEVGLETEAGLETWLAEEPEAPKEISLDLGSPAPICEPGDSCDAALLNKPRDCGPPPGTSSY